MAQFTPIGTIHTPHTALEGMPIQPPGARGIEGTVEILEAYQEGLADLEGFSHVILLYHFHRSSGFRLTVTPFMDTVSRGLFATRAPRRPNPIGLSVVRLKRIDAGVLTILDADMLDGTPLLDIKPYVPGFDTPTEVRVGWLAEAQTRVSGQRSDDRFIAS